MGSIDTRRSYRLFDLDGGGRTHFDRHLDVVFYTPGLNIKVSFDHILNRPDDLKRELENCYLPNYNGSQLVSIVTDGEIYGHHEKHGEEALSRLFQDIAPSIGLKVVSAGEFIRDNPPTWEVKLWNGEDGRGSSWSCEHGVGRWHRDCGCRPPTPPGWNQRWRGPVRGAFDALRDRVRFVARRELGSLVWDADDAREDYIAVILKPTVETRREFVRRHGQRSLTLEEIERLWRILEASHNAMLMYSSCGWFFDEVSGLEPVQNMRYALRAAELIQPWHDEDLIKLLEDRLGEAESNIPHFGDGAKVFRELALPSRHDNRELAAAMAVCLAAGFPADVLDWKVVDKTETVNYADSGGHDLSWGSFVCHDERLDRFVKAAWVARLNGFDSAGVALHGFEEAQGNPERERGELPLRADGDFSWLREAEKEAKGLKREELLERLGEVIVTHERLPEAIRGMLYRKFSGAAEDALLRESAGLGTRAVPFLARAHRHGARVPEPIVKNVTTAFELQMTSGVYDAISGMDFSGEMAGKVEAPRGAAWDLGVGPSQDVPYRAVFLTGLELLHWLGNGTERGWFDALRPIELDGGGEWLAPTAEANHDLRYPMASGLSMALGKGLALLWSRLRGEADAGLGALRILPVAEVLEYGRRLGLEPRGMTALGIAYWDFLDKPLRRIIRSDPVGIMGGELGEKVRSMGRLLGFADVVVEKRIAEASQ